MQRLIVLAVAIGVLVLLASGLALAQEEPLPDLAIDKTGPSTATPGEYVTYNIDVTNVGSGDAVLPSGAVLVRDDIRSRSGRFTAFGFGNVNTTEGVTGLPFGLHNEFAPGGTRTKQTINLLIPPWEPSDAIISPGGALRGSTISTATEASGGFIIDCATVDPDNVIVESDESNNTDCVTTKIVP
jgi:uncharacterized repeat protein (TIGR01451 family)